VGGSEQSFGELEFCEMSLCFALQWFLNQTELLIGY